MTLGFLSRISAAAFIRLAACLAALTCAVNADPAPAADSDPDQPAVDMGALSLKRIMDLDVTSVSKRTQKMRDVPTSIYVINEDDIKRSGATRLTDLLQMAPGAWDIEPSYTIQAFAVREESQVFSHSVAYVIDGVPVTNPIIGGVFFNALDIPLEDIERIEIIKGSGGTIYGANSASGIVSIFTKRGEGALGLKASLSGGTQDYLAPYLRYGWEAKDDLFLNVWARWKTHSGYDRNPLFAGDTLDAPINGGGDLKVANRFTGSDDDQNALSGGVKWEYQPSDDVKWTGQVLESHVDDGQYSIHYYPWPDAPPPAGQPVAKRPDSIYAKQEQMDQTIVQARVDVAKSKDDGYFIHAYHWRDRYNVDLGSSIEMGYDISELETQRNTVLDRHRLSVGANVRRVQFEFADMPDDGSDFVSDPHNLAYLMGAFVQDEISLGKRWRLTLGAKAETWTLIALTPEISPNLRIAYKPSEETTWWMAVSRSIATPTYAQWDIEVREAEIPPDWYLQRNVPGYKAGSPAAGHFVALVPGNDVKPSDYYSVEAGQRGSIAQKFQWDVSAFYSWVRGQLSLTPLDSSLQTLIPSKAHPPDSIVPLYETNLVNYETAGGEAVLRYVPADFLRLEASYSMLYALHPHGLAIPGDTAGRTYQVKNEDLVLTPHHIIRGRAYCELPWKFDLNVDGLLSSPFSRGEAFNYYQQVPESQAFPPGQSIIADPPAWQFQLDFSLRKRFFGDRLSWMIWGRNVLADPYVEIFNQYGWVSFPHQIHRTFGTQAIYQF